MNVLRIFSVPIFASNTILLKCEPSLRSGPPGCNRYIVASERFVKVVHVSFKVNSFGDRGSHPNQGSASNHPDGHRTDSSKRKQDSDGTSSAGELWKSIVLQINNVRKKHVEAERRRKIGMANKGKTPWNKRPESHVLSEDKLDNSCDSQTRKYLISDQLNREGSVSENRGQEFHGTGETSPMEKLSISEMSERKKCIEAERRRKIGLANKGRTPWNKGRQHKPETRELIRIRTIEAIKCRIRRPRAGLSHSEESKLKIGIANKRRWEEHHKEKEVKEKCYLTWASSVAEAAKVGHYDQDELEWNSYEKLQVYIVSEHLQQRDLMIKKREINRLKKILERTKRREARMKKLENNRREKEERAKAAEMKALKKLKDKKNAPLNRLKLKAKKSKCIIRRPRAGFSHSEESKLKIGIANKRRWEERQKEKEVKEKCYLTWASSVAEAAKVGHYDQDELEWNSHDNLQVHIVSEHLQPRDHKTKKREINELKLLERTKRREARMKKLENTRREKEERAKAAEMKVLKKLKDEKNAPLNPLKLEAQKSECIIRRPRAGLSHSEESKLKIGIANKRCWEEPQKEKKVKEKCYLTWASSVAEAAKVGHYDQDELEWNSYEKLQVYIVSEHLQQRDHKTKKREINELRLLERTKRREARMKKLENTRREKEERAKAAEMKVLKKLMDKKNAPLNRLKLKAKKSKLRVSVPVEEAGHRNKPEDKTLDLDFVNKERIRKAVSFEEQIRAAKSRKMSSNSNSAPTSS